MGNAPKDLVQAHGVAVMAAVECGYRPAGLPQLVASAGHIVFRLPVKADIGRLHGQIAVRVMQPGSNPDRFRQEYEDTAAVARVGAPVVRPLESGFVELRSGTAALWEWHPFGGGKVSMKAWGESLAKLHQVESPISRKYDPLQGFDVRIMEERISSVDNHPLRKRPEVVRLVRERLDEQLAVVAEHDGASPLVLLHGDNHLLNVGGQPLKFGDLEHSGMGAPAHDFAIVGLGVRRYEAWHSAHLAEMLMAYGADAPSEAELRPYIDLRQTVWASWVLTYADVHDLEAVEARLAVIQDPEATTSRWTHVGDPELMNASGIELSRRVEPAPGTVRSLGEGGLGTPGIS